MTGMIGECRRCGSPLTIVLQPVASGFEPDFPADANVIPQGHFWTADKNQLDFIQGHVMVHLDDVRNMKHHPDARRHNGCCGEDGCDGPNRVCECGNAVGTLVSDCWTSFYFHFEPDTTRLREV